MGIEAQGKMVEQVDRDDKKEDKAANEVVDNVLTSMLATTACTGLQLAKECLNLKKSKAAPPKMLRLIQNQLFESICARNICLRSAHGYTRHTELGRTKYTLLSGWPNCTQFGAKVDTSCLRLLQR